MAKTKFNDVRTRCTKFSPLLSFALKIGVLPFQSLGSSIRDGSGLLARSLKEGYSPYGGWQMEEPD